MTADVRPCLLDGRRLPESPWTLGAVSFWLLLATAIVIVAITSVRDGCLAGREVDVERARAQRAMWEAGGRCSPPAPTAPTLSGGRW